MVTFINLDATLTYRYMNLYVSSTQWKMIKLDKTYIWNLSHATLKGE